MAVRLLRKKLNASVTRFTGDAFAYLDRRGTKEAPGKIVLEVLNALRDAKNKGGDDKLVVIAHSFGGEIVYDILTYFDPTLSVDCLFTVGSQVGLFEEMKLYKASRPELPPDWKGRVIRPASLKRWLNVFDTNDVLGYRLEPIFNEVHDYYYDTGYSSFSAHGGYFMRPSFYKRLAARLAG
jgi:pimeloyl-ACP methyl ester carboxylesterase